MPRSETGSRRRWTRSFAVLLDSLLGLAAVCLVVFGTTQKQLQIGVLLGLWAGLIGAFLLYGARRGQPEQAAQLAEAEQRVRELHEAQSQVSALQRAQLTAAEEARVRQEVELRKLGEIQLSREVTARREADLQLELSLRREIERMMNEQIGRLREEVAALRAEVVDKLGGQLRLERIETTRLIGSDLEALQHEIRRLAGQEGLGGGAAHSIGSAPSQLTSGRTVSVSGTDPGWTDGWRSPADQDEPGRDAGSSAGPRRVSADRPDIIEAEPARFGPATAASPVGPGHPAGHPESAGTTGDQRQRGPSDPFDLLAGLPRLSPVPADLELISDPLPADPAAEQRPSGGEQPAPSGGYHGRRRAAEPEDEPPSGGGRRRAPDDAPDDLLARLRRH
jgi:hypothetical protein